MIAAKQCKEMCLVSLNSGTGYISLDCCLWQIQFK